LVSYVSDAQQERDAAGWALPIVADWLNHTQYARECGNRLADVLFQLASKWHYLIASQGMRRTRKKPAVPMTEPLLTGIDGGCMHSGARVLQARALTARHAQIAPQEV